MTTKSSQLLHLDPLAIALEKRRQQEEQSQTGEDNPKDTSQPTLSSQPNMSRLLNVSSQPVLSSQPIEQPPGGPVSSQPTLSRQANTSSQLNVDNQFSTKPLNLLASIPDIKGEARVPHRYSDYLCRLLKADEQAVYWQLYRLSWGWGQETCFISNPKLSERSNVPLSSMKRAVAGLVSKGLIEKTGQANGYGKDQGVEYKVFTLGCQPNTSSQLNMSSQPNVAPIKKEKLKEKVIPPSSRTKI